MPVANNLLTSVILAPIVAILSAVSLSTLQRTLEWVTSVAKNPQKGMLRTLRPYAKHVDTFLDRIFGGQKLAINTTSILLMAVVILLICSLLEGSEKPKSVRVIKERERKED